MKTWLISISCLEAGDEISWWQAVLAATMTWDPLRLCRDLPLQQETRLKTITPFLAAMGYLGRFLYTSFFAPKQVTHIWEIGAQLVTWMSGKDTMRCCNRRPFVLIRTAGSLIGINLQLEQGEQCEQANATTVLPCPSTQSYAMLYTSCPSMLNNSTNGVLIRLVLTRECHDI